MEMEEKLTNEAEGKVLVFAMEHKFGSIFVKRDGSVHICKFEFQIEIDLLRFFRCYASFVITNCNQQMSNSDTIITSNRYYRVPQKNGENAALIISLCT